MKNGKGVKIKMSLVLEGKCVGVVQRTTRKQQKPYQRLQVLCETAKGGVVLYNVDDFGGGSYVAGKDVKVPVYASPFVMNGIAYVNYIVLNGNGNGAGAKAGGFKP